MSCIGFMPNQLIIIHHKNKLVQTQGNIQMWFISSSRSLLNKRRDVQVEPDMPFWSRQDMCKSTSNICQKDSCNIFAFCVLQSVYAFVKAVNFLALLQPYCRFSNYLILSD